MKDQVRCHCCRNKCCNFPPISGRASRVGGEPGITKAVLTKIQVGVKDVFVSLYVAVLGFVVCALTHYV